MSIRPRLVLRCASSVQGSPVRWLWPGRVPLGKLTLIAGDPGLGKSLVCADMAARVSTGRGWPCTPDAGRVVREPGKVWLLSCEDDEADTLRPRLEAAGAACANVYFPQGVSADDKSVRPLKLDIHTVWLEEFVQASGGAPQLIVIDPITAYLGSVDAHNQAEVRGLLAPLCAFAQKHAIAIVGVIHLNKREDASGVYRISGSLAFPAAARAVWWVKCDPDDPNARVMLPTKFNLGPPPSGLRMTIQSSAGIEPGGLGAPRVCWEDEIAPDTVLAPSAPESLGAIDDAKDFLLSVLEDGPRPAAEILALADSRGISKGTLSRARSELNIITNRVQGRWHMRLPPTVRKSAGLWVQDVKPHPHGPQADEQPHPEPCEVAIENPFPDPPADECITGAGAD
jgi:hypothetical protein